MHKQKNIYRMKTYTKIITLLLLSLFAIQVEAQRIGDLNGINYQAVAIDDNGKEIILVNFQRNIFKLSRSFHMYNTNMTTIHFISIFLQ